VRFLRRSAVGRYAAAPAELGAGSYLLELLRGTSTQAFHPADFRAIGRAPTEDLRALAFSGAGRRADEPASALQPLDEPAIELQLTHGPTVPPCPILGVLSALRGGVGLSGTPL
jgi:hypothetical protein